MKLKELCVLEVACCPRDASVAAAARLMRQLHTGDLIVVDETDGAREPIGIVTDRDIIMQVVAEGRDPNQTEVAAVMGTPLVIANLDEDVDVAVERMKTHGVRRLPIVDDSGNIYGILTLDDIQRLQAEQAGALAAIVSKEQTREHRHRR